MQSLRIKPFAFHTYHILLRNKLIIILSNKCLFCSGNTANLYTIIIRYKYELFMNSNTIIWAFEGYLVVVIFIVKDL